MDNQLDLTVIIVSWNSEDWLKRCLSSIYARTSEISFEVILIDNASDDQSVQMAMNNFSGVKVIENKTNVGWATAVNQGIEVSSGKYVCLLNPDTELHDRTLEQMVGFMDQYPSVGLVGPHTMNEDETTQVSIRRRPRLADQLMIILKLHVLFPDAKPIFNYLFRDFNYRETQEVEQLMGSCLMIRREVIDQVGILDENFFLWFDEVDYCRRVFDRTDYKIFYFANTHIIHEGGHSFSQVGSLKKQRWYLNSLRYYFKKHGHWFSYFLILFLTPLSLFLGWLGSIFKRSKKGKNVEAQTKGKFKQHQ